MRSGWRSCSGRRSSRLPTCSACVQATCSSAYRCRNTRGRPIGRVFFSTRRLADESRLQLAAKVFSSSLDAIFVTDAACRIVAGNPQSWRMSGYAEAELSGRDIGELLYQPDDQALIPKLRERLRADGYWESEIWHRKKDGSSCPVLTSFVRVLDGDGEVSQYVIFFKDLTERLAADKRIEELAYHDVLTGLPAPVRYRRPPRRGRVRAAPARCRSPMRSTT